MSVLRDTVTGLVDKLVAAAGDLLTLSDDDLAVEASAPASEEAEETFACRTALLRVHHLLLLSPAACDDDRLSNSLDKILQVPFRVIGFRVQGLRFTRPAAGCFDELNLRMIYDVIQDKPEGGDAA